MNNEIFEKIIKVKNKMLILENEYNELKENAILELEKNELTFIDTISNQRIELINMKGRKTTAWKKVAECFNKEIGYADFVKENEKVGEPTKFIKIISTPLEKINLD